MIDLSKITNYDRINLPVDNFFNVDYTIDNITYNLTFQYNSTMQCWYIKIKTGDIDTGFNKLTQNTRLFPSYKNKMKHCFFTTTTTTLMPMSPVSFAEEGDTFLYCTTNEEYEKGLTEA